MTRMSETTTQQESAPLSVEAADALRKIMAADRCYDLCVRASEAAKEVLSAAGEASRRARIDSAGLLTELLVGAPSRDDTIYKTVIFDDKAYFVSCCYSWKDGKPECGHLKITPTIIAKEEK